MRLSALGEQLFLNLSMEREEKEDLAIENRSICSGVIVLKEPSKSMDTDTGSFSCAHNLYIEVNPINRFNFIIRL